MVGQTKLALLGLYLSVFSYSIMYSTLFPVIGELITNYKPDSPRSDQGLWLGKLSFFFFLGEFLSFPLQVWLSSILGNRLLHLLSTFNTALFSLLLSYSTNFDSILTLRFFQGFCCPVIYSSTKLIRGFFNKSPEKGENYIQRFYLVGVSAGFFIGGFMNDKIILGSSKYLTGNFLVVIFGIISFGLCLKYVKNEENRNGNSFLGIFIDVVQIFKVPGVLSFGAVYLLACVAGAGLELVVLWMLARSEDGGFNIKIGDLWKILCIYSTFVYIFIFIWGEKILAKLGKIQACKDSLKFCAICLFAFPIFAIANASYTNMYLSMIGGNFLYFTSAFIAENTSLSLLSQVSEDSSSIRVKELALAISKLFKAVTIYMICWSFSTHIKEKSFPFDFSFTFLVLGLVLLFASFTFMFLKEVKKPILSLPRFGDAETLLEPSSEILEIPIKSNELKLIRTHS